MRTSLVFTELVIVLDTSSSPPPNHLLLLSPTSPPPLPHLTHMAYDWLLLVKQSARNAELRPFSAFYAGLGLCGTVLFPIGTGSLDVRVSLPCGKLSLIGHYQYLMSKFIYPVVSSAWLVIDSLWILDVHVYLPCGKLSLIGQYEYLTYKLLYPVVSSAWLVIMNTWRMSCFTLW